jgi:predicted TIM-barrel fold metal-dependent hydrolase
MKAAGAAPLRMLSSGEPEEFMHAIALEEHYAVPELAKRVSAEALAKRGFPPPGTPSPRPQIDERLADLGASRLQSLDEAGISHQVLSLSGVGADMFSLDDGKAFAREANDALADAVARHPDRLGGFAHLPLLTPDAAADELQRCVEKLGFVGGLINGTTDGLFLDDARFEPVLARFEALGVPLYLHPGVPPLAIQQAYYGGLPGALSPLFARAGWGWHAETAVHVIRLALSGALDKHPRLQIVIGHLGEGLPAMLDRFDETFNGPGAKFLQRKVSDIIRDQVHITTSGFFNMPSFLNVLQTFGADRILFSVDYPFADNMRARRFLDNLAVSPEDKKKIAYGNAEKLLRRS